MRFQPKGLQFLRILFPIFFERELLDMPVEQLLTSLRIEQWVRLAQLGRGISSYDRTGMDSGEIRSSIILDRIRNHPVALLS